MLDILNSLLDNHTKLVKNNRFWVFIGVLKLSFTKVTGFEQTVERETFIEGGVNDSGIEMVVPTRDRKTLRFERGLQSWSPVLSRMKPGVAIPLGITVIMMNDNNFPVQTYHASDCIVTKWEISDINASEGTVMIETFEVSYSTCDRTNLQLF